MTEDKTQSRGRMKLAVLIDADNVSYNNIKEILEEITKYGITTIKRIYGDWTAQKMAGWKNCLLEYSITPIQQYAYTVGKNATDSALIIDAMDILHKENVDGFCIISSDSDFTRLASRLRESGKLVIGIGERKTPKPFIASCNQFIYVEILRKNANASKSAGDSKSSEAKKPSRTAKPKAKAQPAAKDAPKSGNGGAAAEKEVAVSPDNNSNGHKNGNGNGHGDRQQEESSLLPVDKHFIEFLQDTVEDVSDDTGWASLGDVGNSLSLRQPDFDSRNYGYPRLSVLFKSLGKYFAVEMREVGDQKPKVIYVSNKY